MTLAVDVSNYTDALTPTALAAWQRAGVRLVIVQAVDPPPSFPRSQTRDQVTACAAAGLQVDAYVWLWFDQDDIASKLALLDGLPIRRLWLDVEDTAAQRYNQADTEARITTALRRCDDWQLARGVAMATGIYTGRWYWTDARYLANSTTFSNSDLWDASYDGQITLEGFAPYGGWTSRAMHQYAGTSTLGGVGNVDLNVLTLAPQAMRETPADWPWPTWREAAI